MSYRELRRSDLLDALFALEREEDINRWAMAALFACMLACEICICYLDSIMKT
jgi:hypothetical protein